MTDTITTDIDDAGQQPIGELEHLDPKTLLIADNVRTHADLDKDLVASIELHRHQSAIIGEIPPRAVGDLHPRTLGG